MKVGQYRDQVKEMHSHLFARYFLFKYLYLRAEATLCFFEGNLSIQSMIQYGVHIKI